MPGISVRFSLCGRYHVVFSAACCSRHLARPGGAVGANTEVLTADSANPRLVRSTVDVADDEAADYWSDMVCRTLVKVATRPACWRSFRGRIEHFAVEELEFSMVSSEAQNVERTSRQIDRGHEDSVMLNIQLSGQGLIAQDGRAAFLTPGAMTFLDSTRPYSLRFDGTFS